MTTVTRCCASCAYWRAGTSPSMNLAAHDQSYDDMGACENVPPQVFIINEGPETLQPTTHATRCCADWSPDWIEYGGPDGGGEPQPVPDRDPSRVRNLFPIRPAPIAA